jgi:hypothetical protein
MPRRSPYKIVLTVEQKVVLEKIAHEYTSSYCDVIRAKAILLAAQGLDNKEIGVRVDLPRQIVSKWRKRFFLEGTGGLSNRPRRGRLPSFSPSRARRH